MSREPKKCPHCVKDMGATTTQESRVVFAERANEWKRAAEEYQRRADAAAARLRVAVEALGRIASEKGPNSYDKSMQADTALREIENRAGEKGKSNPAVRDTLGRLATRSDSRASSLPEKLASRRTDTNHTQVPSPRSGQPLVTYEEVKAERSVADRLLADHAREIARLRSAPFEALAELVARLGQRDGWREWHAIDPSIESSGAAHGVGWALEQIENLREEMMAKNKCRVGHISAPGEPCPECGEEGR